jgi:hypothetical protein
VEEATVADDLDRHITERMKDPAFAAAYLARQAGTLTDRIATVLHDAACPSGSSCGDDRSTWSGYYRDAAAIVAVLTREGRLIPEGSEVTVQYATLPTNDPTFDAFYIAAEDVSLPPRNRERPSRNGVVLTRRVIVTPPEEETDMRCDLTGAPLALSEHISDKQWWTGNEELDAQIPEEPTDA